MKFPCHPIARAARGAMPRVLSAAVLAGGLALPAAAQNLAALYELARGHDASFQSAQAALDAARHRADQARAGLLPQAALSAGVNRVMPSNGSDYTGRSAALSASQPLWRPANRIAAEQGLKQLEVAEAQLRAAEQDLIVRLAQAYFDVLAARDNLTFVQAQKAAVAEQLAAAKRNFEVGTATITDTREAQARFDLVTAQEIAAENDLRVKRLALDNLVGRSGADPRPLAAPVALPPLAPDNVQAWVEQAEDHSPAIVQARLALEAARLESAKARSAQWPTVDLNAQLSHSRSPSAVTGRVSGNEVGSIGVQLNWPLYTGGAVQGRMRETVALEAKGEADLEAARRAVAQGTRSAFFGVLSGINQVKALEAAEVSSQTALDANKLGYQVGVRINIDVLNAQSQLFQTKRDLAQARYNVLVGGLRLRQANGTLAAADLGPVNALLAR